MTNRYRELMGDEAVDAENAMFASLGYCAAECSHGGCCTLDKGHTGNHSASGMCEWPLEQVR